MKPTAAREGREVGNNTVTVWRPWQLKPLELFQAVAVSDPSRQLLIPEYLLVCVQSGTADFQYRNTHVNGLATPGAFCVIEPGEPWTRQLKDFTHYCLTIEPAWLQETATSMLHWEKGLPHFPSQPLFDLALGKVVSDLAIRSLSPTSRLHQQETLMHLLASLLLFHTEHAGIVQQPDKEYPVARRAKDFLQAHYTEEVSLQTLAGVVNMSPFHLAHIFRQTVGMAPHAYQTKLRLAHARTLLAQGLDVGYVAQETGFFDQTHFTRQFKRHYLVTPGSYRKTARFY
jgi:AraC-like DNA-binding protein